MHGQVKYALLDASPACLMNWSSLTPSGADERAGEALARELLVEGRALGVVAGVEHGVGLGVHDLGDHCREVLLAGGDLLRPDQCAAEPCGGRRAQSDAVIGVVLDEVDLLRAQLAGQELGCSRTLHGIVTQAAEEGGPAVLRQAGVGSRRRDVNQALLFENVAGCLGFTREREADDADDVRFTDQPG